MSRLTKLLRSRFARSAIPPEHVNTPVRLSELDSHDGSRMVFICGCGHSGSTLLATMLSVHPLIHVPLLETEVFMKADGEATAALRRVYRDFLQSGKALLVEKSPRHIKKLERIRQSIPGARFILMVRDGRDVTASIANKHPGNFSLGFDMWVAANLIVRGERRRKDVLVVRYEDMVEDPEKEIGRVCQFLGVEYLSQMLRYHDQPRLWFGLGEIRRTDGVGSDHLHLRNWQVNQPIFDGRGRWKRDLPQDVVKKFERGHPRRLMEIFRYAQPSQWRWLRRREAARG